MRPVDVSGEEAARGGGVGDRREDAAVATIDRAEAARAAVVEQARADIALIRELMERIKGDFYKMGLLLKRLKDAEAARALGYRSFEEMCKKEIGLSGSSAVRLVRIVESMSPELARGLGQYQALAVLQLCEAAPEDDTVKDLVEGGLRLPSGKVLDVAGSSVREKKDAVKEIRESGGKTSGKGGTKGGTKTSAEDRRVAAEAEAALHAVGLKRARVRAVARPGKVGDLKIEGIPTSELGRLCKALCARRGK